MSFDPETSRIVRSWLSVDEHESADRVLRHVLDQLPATPQRRAWWPARRMPEMPNTLKLAIGAAAIVVASLVGLNLLSGDSTPGIGGPAASPSPSPSLSPSPSPSPSPTPVLSPQPTSIGDSQPPAGPLAVGRHSFSQNGVRFSLDVTTLGWSSSGVAVAPDGGTLTKGAGGSADGAWILLWSIDGVFADPCGHVPGPVLSPSADDLAAAVTALPGASIVSPPTDVTLGGRTATYLAITFDGDLGCSPSQYFMWYDDAGCGSSGPCERWVSTVGQVNRIWIFEVGDTHVWIEAETYPGASPQIDQEIQQIIDSIQFEQPG